MQRKTPNLFYLAALETWETTVLKMYRAVLYKKYCLRCWNCLSFLSGILGFLHSLLLKLPLRKLEPWYILLSFFLLSFCLSLWIYHQILHAIIEIWPKQLVCLDCVNIQSYIGNRLHHNVIYFFLFKITRSFNMVSTIRVSEDGYWRV